MQATAIEVKSLKIAQGPTLCRLDYARSSFWTVTCKMEEGTYKEFKTFPNLIQCDGKTFGKTAWNSDNLTVCYTTAAASRYATEVK